MTNSPYSSKNKRSLALVEITKQLLSHSCVSFDEPNANDSRGYDMTILIGFNHVQVKSMQSEDDRVFIEVDISRSDYRKVFEIRFEDETPRQDDIDSVVQSVLSTSDYIWMSEKVSGPDAALFEKSEDSALKFVSKAFTFDVAKSWLEFVDECHLGEFSEMFDNEPEFMKEYTAKDGSTLIVSRMSDPIGVINVRNPLVNPHRSNVVWKYAVVTSTPQLYSNAPYVCSRRIGCASPIRDVVIDAMNPFKSNGGCVDYDDRVAMKLALEKSKTLWPNAEFVGMSDRDIAKFVSSTESGKAVSFSVNANVDHTGYVEVYGEVVGHECDTFQGSICWEAWDDYECETGIDLYDCRYNDCGQINDFDKWYDTKLEKFMLEIADDVKTADKFKVCVIENKFDLRDEMSQAHSVIESASYYQSEVASVVKAIESGQSSAVYQPPNENMRFDMNDVVKDGSVINCKLDKLERKSRSDDWSVKSSNLSIYGV